MNTRNKRASAILVGLGFGRVFPNPDGAITAQADRQQAGLSYAGIVAQSVAQTLVGVWDGINYIRSTTGQRIDIQSTTGQRIPLQSTQGRRHQLQ